MHGNEDGKEKDANNPDNQKLQGDAAMYEQQGGPAGQRHCTDCLCVLLIGACWIAMTGVGFAALGWIDSEEIPRGNPYRLINAIDWNGQLCGFGADVKGKNYAYYMASGEAVCVKKCPSKTDYNAFVCKNDPDVTARMATAQQADAAVSETSTTFYQIAGFLEVADTNCMFKMQSTGYMGYCVPDELTAAAQEEAQAAATVPAGSSALFLNTTYNDKAKPEKSVWEQFCADMFAAAGYIFGFGFGVAMVCSFLYVWLMRIPGVLTLVIWGLLTAVQVFLLALFGLAYTTYMAWDCDGNHKDIAAGEMADDFDVTTECAESYSSERDAMKIDGMQYFSFFLLAVALLWFIVVFCCLRKRIMLAIAVVKEAGKALSAQKLLVLFPVIQLAGCAAFVAPWCVYCLFLASSGELQDITACYDYMGSECTPFAGDDLVEIASDPCKCVEYKEMVYTTNQRYAGLYLLFSWFWTSEFIIAMGQLVVALAISTWYFTREDPKGYKNIGNSNVIYSIKTAFRYHAGSAAFGALIIAIIKTIRAIIAYLQKKAKKSGNKLAQLVLCIIQSCMWCVEKTMKFINKNAYIQIAIFGYSFCKAARRAFFLIARNILRIAAVSIVSSFVLLIGKVLVPVGTTTLCYLFLTSSGGSDGLAGLWAPLFLVFLLSFFTVQMFNEVFGMAIWTILQCFVADEEMFGSGEGHMFAPGSLKSCISDTQRKAMELAAEEAKKSGKTAPEPEESAAPAGGNTPDM